MYFIYEVLENNFWVKIFLVPAILGGIFLSKNIIHKISLIENKYVAFFLYSSNFTIWILLLKLLFLEIDQGVTYGYLLSDISLVFIAIVIDYFIVSYYANIEFAVIPAFIIFFLFYIYYYGIDLKSTLFIVVALTNFWITLYLISKNKVIIMQSYTKIIWVSISILFSVELLSLSQFRFSWGYTLGLFCKTFILLVISKFVFIAISSIIEDYSKYKRFTYIDTLTNAYNRRKFEETISEIIASKQISKFSLVFFDLDNFKYINDVYNHNAGDYVLKEICSLVKKCLTEWEENGQLFRYGGDEFILIFRNQGGEKVKRIMNKVIKEISNYKFYNKEYSMSITISAGISEFNGNISQEEAICSVDKNLYIAKAKGKNQVYFNDRS